MTVGILRLLSDSEPFDDYSISARDAVHSRSSQVFETRKYTTMLIQSTSALIFLYYIAVIFNYLT